MPVELSNVDLLEAARKYKVPLGGVFSKDKIPPRLKSDMGYIINLQDSVDSQGRGLPGTHWVGFWIDGPYRGNKYGYYFDPFGFQPPIEVEKILERLNKNKEYYQNTTQVQNIQSAICGYYSLYFIYYMKRYKKKEPIGPKRFSNFINEFDQSRPQKNRKILEEEFKKHFP